MTTAPRYTARQYRENAALHMTSARQAIDNARQARRQGCHVSAVAILEAAQNYRHNYQRRMRQAALAAEAEQLEALAADYFRQAEAGEGFDARYCYDLAAENEYRARAAYARAFQAT